jgi:hypothetical protein
MLHTVLTDPSDVFQSYTIKNAVQTKGARMSNRTAVLQELREERKEAQAQVEKLDQAISVIESLDGTGTSAKTNQPVRVFSLASRRKMAVAQKARWAKIRKESRPVAVKPAAATPAKPKRTMSAAARKKIAAAQRARWAKVRAGQKKAA